VKVLLILLIVAAFQYFGVSIFPVCRPPVPEKPLDPPHWIYEPAK